MQSNFHRRCALAALCLAPLAAQADILAVSFSGRVVDLDSATANATQLAAAGPSFNSLAYDGSRYWSVVSFGGQLSTVDPTTGVATLGPVLTGLASESSIRGLAFVGSVLYAVQNEGGATSIGPDALYRVNTATGAATLVGATGQTGLQALAASRSGQLYGWDITLGLMTLDAATGSAADVNASGGSTNVQALAFSPDGVLYGARDQLWTVNLATGALTDVGIITGIDGPDIRGIEFIAEVPEPASTALMAAGAVLLGWRARRLGRLGTRRPG